MPHCMLDVQAPFLHPPHSLPRNEYDQAKLGRRKVCPSLTHIPLPMLILLHPCALASPRCWPRSPLCSNRDICAQFHTTPKWYQTWYKKSTTTAMFFIPLSCWKWVPSWLVKDQRRGRGGQVRVDGLYSWIQSDPTSSFRSFGGL